MVPDLPVVDLDQYNNNLYHPDPEIRWGGGAFSQKARVASVWSNNNGGAGGPPPPRICHCNSGFISRLKSNFAATLGCLSKLQAIRDSSKIPSRHFNDLNFPRRTSTCRDYEHVILLFAVIQNNTQMVQDDEEGSVEPEKGIFALLFAPLCYRSW